jgi:hypothetical protein
MTANGVRSVKQYVTFLMKDGFRSFVTVSQRGEKCGLAV